MFSKNLKFARKKLNISINQLSDELDITRMQLYRYENKESLPPIEKLILISKKVNENLDDMLEIHYNKKVNGDSLGEKIKNIRKEKKLNQEDLAEILKTKQTSICDYEKNRTKPSTEKLIKLCHYFEVSPSEILSNEIENLEID